ncbi:efflux RND transporter periplasmic adaptor subunit [Rhodopirellula bahusiensis]|uniref:efflux RND transporter periplasmic adaptor subunit n=1 Tax=Rhodopirellula bahusiensis TaxID=2014065 RepID=UPI0032642540
MKQHLKRLFSQAWFLQAIAFLAIGFAFAWWLRGPSASDSSAGSQGVVAEHASNAPAIWTCSMHPQIRRDGPGSCPICGMDLVPVKKSASGVRTVSINADVKKLMNIQTVPVGRRYVTADVRMVGKIEYDETRLAHITAWVSGRLDRLYVDFTGVEVNKGDHMAYIYSEELYTAQQELIAALESNAGRSSSRFVKPIDLAESAREKLRLLGITEGQIQGIEQRGKPTEHLTIYSPASGIVVEKLRQEGDRVRTGDRIYTVADLSHLWVQMDAYESDLAWLRYGQEVEFTTEAYPGEVFKGQIAFIDPVLNKDTRTVKVRVNVSNEDGRLKPEMFVRAIVRSKIAAGGRVLDASLAGKWISPMHPEIVKDEPGDCDICGMPLVRAESLGYVTAEPSDTAKPLVIPVSAALLTGTRAIVYVQVPDAEEPTYEGREIVLGPRAGDYYLVKSGLKEGELVVTNGNFKLDSALQISAKPSMMTPSGGGGGGGHNHGGDAMPKGDGDAMTDHSQMSLPPKVSQQMLAVLESVKSVEAAIEEAELSKIRDAFAMVGQRVAAVDGNALSGDMGAQWREFAMWLRNDSVEGQDIQSLQDADRVTLVTKEHAMRLQKMFGISHAGHEMPEETLDVPMAFRQQLDRLLPAYLAIGDGLASDKVATAASGVDQLHQSLNSIDTSGLDDVVAKRWASETRSLSSITARLAKATDLEAMRSAFALLSDELITIQRMFGFHSGSQLFELHCPMAFDGRGATWLQSNDTVRNPYYGGSMLKCADKVAPLITAPPPRGGEHDKHNHG